ncbi:MAG: hypothetical protein COX44_01060 [Candidatus Portnoybacteria bacterium CG23_combo_of_CG06-09_8_20_14_all_37_13]|uniref:UPF0235 protein COX44_01060 n=1 Tax=Candidatus Portnoybacteria bacterium CG23_combo_of_CG06-09_8_20_14_all_37_13 TaxID=1974819 RepID=A0A2G9YDC8_9BACT|nr:MAG: hypothetical protein COX44_01060 [Candidatus Portnoybacteria bacterium CG23_combo_of_CG06-09_8_20_14_all_37_13]
MLIRVKVFPNSKKQLVEKKEGNFEVWVKERPIKGQANRAVIDALAEYFGCPRENVKLIGGFRERNKAFEIKAIQRIR